MALLASALRRGSHPEVPPVCGGVGQSGACGALFVNFPCNPGVLRGCYTMPGHGRRCTIPTAAQQPQLCSDSRPGWRCQVGISGPTRGGALVLPGRLSRGLWPPAELSVCRRWVAVRGGFFRSGVSCGINGTGRRAWLGCVCFRKFAKTQHRRFFFRGPCVGPSGKAAVHFPLPTAPRSTRQNRTATAPTPAWAKGQSRGFPFAASRACCFLLKRCGAFFIDTSTGLGGALSLHPPLLCLIKE